MVVQLPLPSSLTSLWPLVLLILLAVIYLLLAYWFRWWPFRPARFPPQEFYVQNQVVVTGTRAVIDDAISRVSGVRLGRLDRLEFNRLGATVRKCEKLPKDLVVDLYKIEGLFPNVEKAISAINNAVGADLTGPNPLTGHPWEPEGSPWEPEGSPWEPEGSLLSFGSRPQKERQDPQPAWFKTQWAFDNIDLAGRPDSITGTGIRVGVFDTSPYDDEVSGQTVAQPKAAQWVQWPTLFEFQEFHPEPAVKLKPSRKDTVNVRNHGLFVAGLIHAVAPGSQIHLVRVLNKHNRGDLFTLVRETFNFMLKVSQASGEPTGAVINLSLGVRVPPKEANMKLPSDARALEYLMIAARCLNIVVVAAAGNESKVNVLQPANLPAGWDAVIGVAASNKSDERACFSNQGDIAAPGGDGAPQTVPGETRGSGRQAVSGATGSTRGCRPAANDCKSAQCEHGVIGPVSETPVRTGFIFWTGSSFATPMVSGLAALVLQAGGGRYTPVEVREILYRGATHVSDPALGAGVINVRRTLEQCHEKAQEQTYSQESFEREKVPSQT